MIEYVSKNISFFKSNFRSSSTKVELVSYQFPLRLLLYLYYRKMTVINLENVFRRRTSSCSIGIVLAATLMLAMVGLHLSSKTHKNCYRTFLFCHVLIYITRMRKIMIDEN